MASLVFLPAVICFCIGVSMFSVVGSLRHTPDAVSDPSGVVPIIALGMCAVGAVIAFFGILVLTKPLRRPKDHETG